MALDLPRSQFFHIQKTGGTWVRQAIRNAGIPVNEVGSPDFHGIREIRPLAGHFFHAHPSEVVGHGKFRFIFVRNPLTWYQSMYAFQSQGNWVHGQFSSADSFDAFMERMLIEHPGYVSKIYRWYGDVDYIGRFESLADDLVTALRTAGETFDEAALRATPRQNVAASSAVWKDRCAYTEDLRLRVVESERQAFKTFNFDPHAVETVQTTG